MERFKIKNFYHLLDYDFHIPSFQRGYRWEKKQIEDLLDDLKEFCLNKEEARSKSEPIGYYCLQPIVVRKRDDGDKSYDVLDGQQRLTTIYLILTCLEEAMRYNITEPKLFSLHFEMREEKEGNYITSNKFKDANDRDYKNNIDYFFIYQAYKIIDTWFQSNKEMRSDMVKLLAARPGKGNDDVQEDVRVIWYEISSEEDSIEVFSRLNYGKIGLTETELIKALILQCDVYGAEKKYMSQWTLKVGSDWDRIEKELQEPNFWAMLATDKQQKASESTLQSRISLVLEFVAKRYLSIFDENLKCYRYKFESKNDESNQNKIKPSKYNSRYTYDVINKYLSEKNDACHLDFKVRVNDLWEQVLDTFSILKNWYEDHEIFHLLGLLRLLKKDDDELLLNLFVKYNGKKSFQEYLKVEIGKEVKIKSKYKDSKGKESVNSLDTINYHDNAKEIIKILELFNVHLMIESHQDSARFDFATFRKQNVTSLEHIHPQNLEETEITFKDLKEWIDRKKEDWYEDGLKDAFDMLDSLDEKNFSDKRETWMSSVRRIDSRCNELAEIDEEIMHSIKNLALIDKDTNAALQNYLLDKKRNKLKERSNEKVYIPIGTWHVFNKFFSENVSELKFWGEKDRDAYFDKIKEVYNLYVK